MTLGDIVRINAYVVGAEYLAGYMKVRDEFIGNPPPASTLMVVSGFARREFKVEVEAVAARAP
jgi:2-iminobutanoate/2-iminopropanoate deaminase